MHARVVTLQIQPGKMAELSDIFQNSVIPEVRKLKGFKSLTLLEDPDTDKAMMMSTWETEADMRASEASGEFQRQIAKFSACMACPPTRELYEVRAQS